MMKGYTAAEAASSLLRDSGLADLARWEDGLKAAKAKLLEIATKQPILMRHPSLVGVATHSLMGASGIESLVTRGASGLRSHPGTDS